jgi:hypothetical protein
MLLVGNVISIGLFFVGLRFLRMERLPEKNYQGPDTIEGLHRLAKIFMFAAPAFMIFWNLMMFGSFGSVEGIETF